jgi:hypothetical protein
MKSKRKNSNPKCVANTCDEEYFVTGVCKTIPLWKHSTPKRLFQHLRQGLFYIAYILIQRHWTTYKSSSYVMIREDFPVSRSAYKTRLVTPYLKARIFPEPVLGYQCSMHDYGSWPCSLTISTVHFKLLWDLSLRLVASVGVWTVLIQSVFLLAPGERR